MAKKRGTQQSIYEARLLIVDDLVANARLLEQVLAAAGFTRLTSTTDSREVLSLFTQIRPDIVLLDLMMPHMDGFEVMQQLKPLITPGDYLPILVLTADVSKESKQRALAMGAKDFVTKPFDQVEVVLRINNLLNTRYLHKQLVRYNQTLEAKVHERTSELTRMLHQVQTAQETERRRVSMEIHDGPLQSLGVSTMAVDRAIRRQGRGEHKLAANELRLLRDSLSSTITEMRAILADLSLDVLDSQGLESALREFFARFSDLTGLNVVVQMGEFANSDVPKPLQVLIYRLAQEALSNIRKHAEATNVWFSLNTEVGELHMTIADDGQGFDVQTTLQEHHAGKQLGLRSMDERIRNAGGMMGIDSTPGKGTTLRFKCPVHSRSADAEVA